MLTIEPRNFTKFLITHEGLPFKRYGPKDAPFSFEDDIKYGANVISEEQADQKRFVVVLVAAIDGREANLSLRFYLIPLLVFVPVFDAAGNSWRLDAGIVFQCFSISFITDTV